MLRSVVLRPSTYLLVRQALELMDSHLVRCQENLFLASVGNCPNDGHPFLVQCGSRPAVLPPQLIRAYPQVSVREIDESSVRIGITSVHFALYLTFNILLRKDSLIPQI